MRIKGAIISIAMSCGVLCGLAAGPAPAGYLVCVSNEKSGDVTLIDGLSGKPIQTIPVGKRPRGIHPSPDGKTLYVAVSGSPISGPPQLDAKGNPIKNNKDDDDDDKNADRSADGIAVVDLTERYFVKKLTSGVDPEQFAVSADGKSLYISNEDVGTMSGVNVLSGRVEHIVPVKKEPEGVTISPDHRFIYVTCETDGEVFAVDAATFRVAANFTVGPRPRNVSFIPDGSRGFVPSESAGQIFYFDAKLNKVLKTIQLSPGSRPMGLAMSPDGAKLYITTGRGGTVLVMDTARLEVENSIKVGSRPWGIALSPDGKQAFVANGPSNDVSVIDLVAGKETSRIKAGEGPWGVTIVTQKLQ